ncbi:hypothetical protein [Knoellia sp. LjRoot47]|uniref:hypothetical protein n=1 Tax=Knoellia sp. LjRoot47 TaxID=3342330 RepID=UPI003ECF5ADE
MIELIIDPRDPELAHLGVAGDGSSVRSYTATIRPSRTVRLTSGGFLSSVVPAPKSATTEQSVTFTVPATDGPEILAADRSTFTYTVDIEFDGISGRGRGNARRLSFAGMLPASLGASAPVTAIVNAEPVPPEFANVADLVADVNAAEAAATSAASSAATSATAATNAANLVGAPADSAVAAAINGTTSNTRVALAGALNRYDIRDYGATTAATDNGPAIQAAMNAAATTKGVVWVPTGTWKIVGKAARTLTAPANVTIEGQDRRGSILKVTGTTDWAFLFCYPTTGSCDGFTVRNLTVDGAGTTGMTGTAGDFAKARTLFNLIGANITIESCDLICNGVWGVKHVGANVKLRDNNITVDLTGYTLGWFDMSVLWSNSMDGRYQDNSFTVIEPTTNTFVAQTAIEFQGHRNTVAGNKTTGSSKFRNGVIFTANTYIDPLATYYPGWPKGADDNVIENNRMTVTRFGVEIWGMAVTSPAPMQRTRIRRNAFTINNVGVAAAGALVSMYLGTPGAPGNDGTQTSPLIDLKISDNVVTYAVRRVSGVYSSADSAVRLYTEVALTGVQVINNTVDNCGGFGVLAYVADASSAWIDGLDVTSNKFVNVREPVRIVRNTKNWRVAEGNVFSQTSIYGTLTDNMIETVAARSGSQTDGTVRGNMIRCAAGHKPFYPIRNQGIAEAFYPASSGFVVEQMGVQLEAPTQTVTVGSNDLVRRVAGTFVKSQFAAGATLGTLTAAGGGAVAITSVTDARTMTVNDATNILPGQVLAIPFNAPFASGSAVVVAVVGNVVYTGANHLAAAAGHAWSEAAGVTLTYYSAVTTVS